MKRLVYKICRQSEELLSKIDLKRIDKLAKALSEELITVPQREVAGARSSSLFAYQKNWALAELIEYHLKGKNYVFAFEFHDDVLILDSELAPTSLKFIQVKTKTNGKNWTIRDLTKSESGKNGDPDKLSVIGKLYENRLNFNSYRSELKFVTNAYFSFGGPIKITCANTLDFNVQATIRTAVQSQLSISSAIDLGCLFFEHSELSVDDHETHIRGKLHTFFDALFGDKHNISVSPWYRSISDQIKKKNDFPPDQISSFDDLIRNKCITRSEIENFIQRVNKSHTTVDHWNILQPQLLSEGYDYKALIRLQRSWKQYATDKLDYDNAALKILEQKIAAEISKYSSSTLSGKINSVKNKLSTELSKLSHLFDEDYITCIIIWLDCEQL
jgi:hypothetical protein